MTSSNPMSPIGPFPRTAIKGIHLKLGIIIMIGIEMKLNIPVHYQMGNP
jgi:hypothetical protein